MHDVTLQGEMKHWTSDKVMKLIELYRERPLLWDPYHPEFKNCELKNQIWLDIAETLSTRDVEKKMNILIVQFRRELKKINDHALKSDSKEPRKSKWFAFDALSFLTEKMRMRQKHLNNSITVSAIKVFSSCGFSFFFFYSLFNLWYVFRLNRYTPPPFARTLLPKRITILHKPITICTNENGNLP